MKYRPSARRELGSITLFKISVGKTASAIISELTSEEISITV
jgi:hypothetical protein